MRSGFVELLIIRHAKSDWHYESLDDHARPLNGRGMRDCLDYLPRVAGRVPVPEHLLVSSAARAIQTGQAVAQAFDLPPAALHVTDAIYEAGVPALRTVMAGLPSDCRTGALVGHNPGLQDLYTWLTGNAVDNLPTLAVVHLRCPTGWQPGRGECELVALHTPRDAS